MRIVQALTTSLLNIRLCKYIWWKTHVQYARITYLKPAKWWLKQTPSGHFNTCTYVTILFYGAFKNIHVWGIEVGYVCFMVKLYMSCYNKSLVIMYPWNTWNTPETPWNLKRICVVEHIYSCSSLYYPNSKNLTYCFIWMSIRVHLFTWIYIYIHILLFNMLGFPYN